VLLKERERESEIPILIYKLNPSFQGNFLSLALFLPLFAALRHLTQIFKYLTLNIPLVKIPNKFPQTKTEEKFLPPPCSLLSLLVDAQTRSTAESEKRELEREEGIILNLITTQFISKLMERKIPFCALRSHNL
jgi:hypothetical protein